MKYALLLYGNASQAPHYTPEEAAAARQAWFDLLAEMKAGPGISLELWTCPRHRRDDGARAHWRDSDHRWLARRNA